MLAACSRLCKQSIFIIVFVNLVLIALVAVEQNRSDARSRQTTINPYQAPLFAALDRKENLQMQMTKAEAIIQNATLNQISSSLPSPSSSNIHHNISELGLPIKNPLAEIVRIQDASFYNSTIEGLSFKIEGIPFSHHRASVNGIDVHYVIGGKGDPIVLLHGWPQSWYEWRHIMPILVRNNYTVIVPDLRGLGDTSKPLTGYDGITTANDVYQLLAQLGVNHSILVGHYIGAQTAYSFATVYPGNVTKLVLLDFVFPGTISEKDIDDPWWVEFHKVPNLPEAIIEGNEREYLSWFYRQLAYNPYSITEQDIDEYVRQYSAPGSLRSGFEYFKAFTTNAIQNNETSKIKLTIPLLAVSGEFSVLKGEKMMMIDNPTFMSAKKLADNVTGVEVPTSGHWIPEEQPSFLAQLLINFINDKV
ncbi:MAG: alpha/beta fold hydrolase [Nitrososphaeraceae archaeon]